MFFCRSEGRFLTDQEFLFAAYRYELARDNVSDELRSVGLDGLQAKNPKCCEVLREEHPANKDWHLLDRLFLSPSVHVFIDWSAKSDTPTPSTPKGRYRIRVCGVVEAGFYTP